MMKFRGRLSFPKFDAKKYNDKLQEEVNAGLKTAAKEWLRAVIPKVPVWAGTSRGSLQPLGRFLKVAIPISPTVNGAKAKNAGPEVGAAQGVFKFSREGKRFIFTAGSGVPHFITNNFYQVPNPPFRLKEKTPWRAFEAGDEAFKAYLSSDVFKRRIPKIKDFVKFETKVLPS